MKRVLFFGTFDPLHAGHKHAFFQAKSLGDFLTVVVARDSAIIERKGRSPVTSQSGRLAAVAAIPAVDVALLGDAVSNSYALLRTIPFDILALGYDQEPSDEVVTELLKDFQLSHVRIVRLQPFLSEINKSSLLRTT